MIADAIVAIPGNAPLPTLLAAIHQERLGHVARVVSVSRAPLADQLQRAGVPMQQSPSFAGVDRVILIFAANMCDRGSRLLLNLGADRAWTVTRTGTWTEVDARAAQIARPTPPSHHHVLSQPNIDIGVQQ